MRLPTPEFWYSDPKDTVAFLLRPLGWLYALAGRVRRAVAKPVAASVPVICVGNLTVGGTGKTPLALAVGEKLAARGLKVAFLSRGYGAGDIKGAMIVDPRQDSASDVGDEPLLLSRQAMTVVSPRRPAGVRLAVSRGAQVVVMDDGFQNPSLKQDLCLVVVDAQKGFGNGCVVPAGPLREPIEDGLQRATALVLMGRGNAEVPTTKPILRADLVPLEGEAERLAGKPLVAFAGIGHPQKFFDTLESCGARVKAMKGFADHHVFSDLDIDGLRNTARLQGATLITTEKDWVRLPAAVRAEVDVLRVAARLDDASDTLLDQLITQCLKNFNPPGRAGD